MNRHHTNEEGTINLNNTVATNRIHTKINKTKNKGYAPMRILIIDYGVIRGILKIQKANW